VLSNPAVEVTDGDGVGYGVVEYGVSKGFGRNADARERPPI
jgi:hypothetical protein